MASSLTRCNIGDGRSRDGTEPSEIEALKAMITRHYTAYEQRKGVAVLALVEKLRPNDMVMPTDYKRMLDETKTPPRKAGQAATKRC